MSALKEIVDLCEGLTRAFGVEDDALISRAREELAAIRAELVETREAYDELYEKRLTLSAENAEMREYVQHSWDCKRSPCGCGLDALLRREDERG